MEGNVLVMEDDKMYIKKQERKVIRIALISILLVVTFIIIGIKAILNRIESSFEPNKELIAESTSSDGRYEIEAYLINGGATVDWSVKCYLKDTNGSDKLIYSDYHVDEAKIIWIDNDTVSINGHEIELPEGKYNFTDEK